VAGLLGCLTICQSAGDNESGTKPAVGIASASMRGRRSAMGPTTAGGVRLDERKAASFSATAQAIGTFWRLPPRSCANFLATQAPTANRGLDYAAIRGMPAQSLSELPYDKWREYDAEDTMRFYALRLREAGLIKSSPQKIIAQGTDWRFLDELKSELKT
jgi:hypothetical protein